MDFIKIKKNSNKKVKREIALSEGPYIFLMHRPLTGASMNPARSLGPAIVTGHYKGLWIYIIGPTLGAIFGAWTYNLMRLTNKSWYEK